MRDENEQVSKEGQEVKKRDNGQQLKLEMPSHMEMNSNEQPLDIEFKKYQKHHKQEEERERRMNVQERKRWRKREKHYAVDERNQKKKDIIAAKGKPQFQHTTIKTEKLP